MPEPYPQDNPLEQSAYPIRFGIGDLMCVIFLLGAQTLIAMRLLTSVLGNLGQDRVVAIAVLSAGYCIPAAYLAYRYVTTHRIERLLHRSLILAAIDAVLILVTVSIPFMVRWLPVVIVLVAVLYLIFPRK